MTNKNNLNLEEGVVVLLNGPSSVGKTSIQTELQKISPKPFLRVGIDTFFDALIEEPDLSSFQETKQFVQHTAQGELIRGVQLLQDQDGFPIVPLTIGPAGFRIIQGMHRAIAAYVKAGNNLVVDYIQYDPTWRADLLHALEGLKAYYVKVHAPLEVIEQREKSRNTSPVGHGRSHYKTVHDGFKYDLELDSSELSPGESALEIVKYLENQDGW